MATWDSFDALYERGDMPAAKKQKKSSENDFSLRSLPHDRNEETIPDIMQESPANSEELVVAETQFFNTRNRSFWSGSDGLSHMRPFDYPYIRRLLECEPNEVLSAEDVRHDKNISQNIEVVPRDYEEQYLREPLKKERKCANNSHCQGLQIPCTGDNSFILREFLLPSQQDTLKRTGKLPKMRQLCLMCRRNEICKAYINIRAEGKGCKSNVILQSYRNIVQKPGEYCIEDTIISSQNCFQGILDPVVMHSRAAYRLVVKNNVRHYEQWKFKKYKQPFLVQAPETKK